MSNLLHIAKWAAFYIILGTVALVTVLAALYELRPSLTRVWEWTVETVEDSWYFFTGLILICVRLLIGIVSIVVHGLCNFGRDN